MDLKVTEYTVDGDGVAVVRFNRPGRGNSWSGRMSAEYKWIMARLDDDPAVRVIVITGAGRQFCVGADFKALDLYAESGEDYAASVLQLDGARPGYGVRPEYDHDLVWHWGMKKPVIAAINGACAGIALAIAAYCDYRYAAEGAKITSASPRFALPAEYGLSWLLPRMIGLTHATDWLVSGRVVLAEEAAQRGFLNEVFAADQFMERVTAQARNLATTLSPLATATTKRQIYAELMSADVGCAVEDSKQLISTLMRGGDYKEGVRALQEKRLPRFGPLDAGATITGAVR